MGTKISKEKLEELGFTREEVSAEESGANPFVYYTLDIENITLISSAWENQDKRVEEEYTVTFLESGILLNKSVLGVLIKNLKNGYK